MLTRVRQRLRATRDDGPLTRALLALLALSVVVSVGLPAIGLGVLHTSDLLQLYAPWATEAPAQVQVHSAATSDTMDATVPVRVEQRRRLYEGDIPLWSDLQAGGAPLAAIPNSSAFSPLTLPWYVLPTWYAPAASKLLEMAVAGGFLFLFARRLRLSRAAALVGALAYVNSGFQVVWTNWPQSHVGALIPALFWAVDRAARRGRATDLVPLALVSATMWLEGFPAVTLWAHTAAGLYALVSLLVRGRGRSPDRGPLDDRGQEVPGSGAEVPAVGSVSTVAWWRRGTVALGGVVLGLGIAAVQLVPFAFRLTQLDVTYRYAPEKIRNLPWRGLVTLLVPDAFGNPVDKVYFADKNYVELVAFVGAVALVLALTGLVTGRSSRVSPWVRRSFWVLATVAVWLAYIGGPPLDAFQRLPVIGPNAIGRMRSLLGFAVAVLAAIGVDGLLRAELARRSRWLVAGLLAVFVAVAGWLVAAVAPIAAEAGRGDYLAAHLVLPGVVLGLALVAVAVVLRARAGSRVRRLGVGALALLMTVETVAFAVTWMPSIDRDQFYPVTAAHRFLAEELGPDRFLAAGTTRDNTFVPGTTTLYDLRSITAHSLTPEAYADLLRAVDRAVFRNNRTYPMIRPDIEAATSPVLDRMAARFYAASPTTPILGRREVVTVDNARQRLFATRFFELEVPVGPMRGVEVSLREPVGPEVVTRLVAEVRDAGGTLLAQGSRRVLARGEGGPYDVPVLPVDGWRATTDGPWTVRITMDASAGALVFGIQDSTVPALSVIRPTPGDGLELVFTEGVAIYRRSRALPRIRWATGATVITDPEARVAALADPALPADTVVLSTDPAGDPAGEAAGAEPRATATLDVVEDSGDVIELTVDAPAAGYLVVADTLQDSWVAEVDDAVVPLVAADHAFVAVPVPAGRHTVSLGYRPAGAHLGGTLTVLALLTLFGAGFPGLRPRLTRTLRTPASAFGNWRAQGSVRGRRGR